MFTRCIHCSQDLGKNESIEAFPVGSMLAFDSVRGRLWVICPHCARWNLTPLEERWEAVEDCERRFRAVRLRAQTANIGLVKLPDGTGLVRIGQPLRPEFAAWRYGREFSRRRVRMLTFIGGASIAVAGVAAGSLYIGLGAAMFIPQFGLMSYRAIRYLAGAPPAFSLPRGPGREWSVSTAGTMILPDPDFGWRINVRHHFGRSEHRGPDGERMLANVLARINRSGGTDSLVQSAVKEVQEHSKADLLRSVAEESQLRWSIDGPRMLAFEHDPWHEPPASNRAGLVALTPVRRLAIEMALHEQTEQRALEGELSALEASWREAEEIAGIADNLLLPAGVDEFIAKQRAARDEEPSR